MSVHEATEVISSSDRRLLKVCSFVSAEIDPQGVETLSLQYRIIQYTLLLKEFFAFHFRVDDLLGFVFIQLKT